MRACPRCLTVYQTDPEYCAFDGARTSPFTEDRDPLVGARLDAFRLEARLGVGGTGCVYRGTHLPKGDPVAIKLLFGELGTDRDLAQRFRREAEAMRRINHPNVVAVLACATTPVGLTYLVMEFVEGRTLRTIIEEEAPLSPGRVGRLAEQLVAGLAQAHRLGYVHRDLKPSNIIIRGAPGSEHAKILDFGIVASLHADAHDQRLTKTGYIVGTPTYMAPEQVDPKAVSPQVDVYALGAMLYEMLSGRPPFTGTLEQILVAKMTSPAPALRAVGELGTLVMRMLATEPEGRPPTALHVSAELARMSLLSPDPATEKARVPELAELGVVGFGQPTVHVIDRTAPTALPDHGRAKDTVEGPWTAPTRLTASALEHDTPDDPYPPFGDDGPTTAAPRPDTLVDAPPPRLHIRDHGTGLGPEAAPEDDEDGQATDLDGPAEIPTTISEAPPGDAFGPEPGTDELARVARDGRAVLSGVAPLVRPATPAPTDSQDTGPADPIGATQETQLDGDALEDEVAFAATRIRPAHLDPLVAPTWTVPDPSRVGLASGVGTGDLAPPPVDDDGPTRLSLIPPDDPGDGDTALDLSLDQVLDPGPPPGFVDTPDPTRVPPERPRGRDHWLLGLLLAASLVLAAVIAYTVLSQDPPTVIEIPPAPGAAASR